MPELPEVETIVRELRAHGLVGRQIRTTVVHWPPMVAPLSPAQFHGTLAGRRITSLDRRGKHIVAQLSEGLFLLIHLRMTGQLALTPASAPRDRHQHVVLALDDGREWRYRDTRKFGRWLLTDDPARHLSQLGPEPLAPDFTPAVLAERLRARRRPIKPLLLDQSTLAGLGNIYVDEALWQAGLHPCRPAHSMTRPEITRLHAAIRKVLRQGIRNQGTSLGQGQSNYKRVGGARGKHQSSLQVFRRTGQACPRCGAAIQRLVVSQRATHICPDCQMNGSQAIHS